MKKNVFVGILLGILFTYLSIRGVSFADVAEDVRGARRGYLLLSVAAMFVMQVLRSLRWGLILRPLERIPPLSLFAVSNVGFLAIVSLPARLGEFVRPYLVGRISKVGMSAGVATIVTERICDSLAIVAMLGIVLLLMPLPAWLVKTGVILLAATAAIFAVLFALVVAKEGALRVLQAAMRKLPHGLAARIERLARSFIEGLAVIRDVPGLLGVLLLTVVIWLVDAGAIYALFLAFDMPLGMIAAFAVMVVLIIAIAIPAAPGFVGNWHFSCVLGLGLFGVARPDALSFAIVYHFLSMAIIIALGLVYLPSNRFSLAKLREQWQRPG
jgi:glycosyltransferase 2 family protein